MYTHSLALYDSNQRDDQKKAVKDLHFLWKGIESLHDDNDIPPPPLDILIEIGECAVRLDSTTIAISSCKAYLTRVRKGK